MPTLKFDYLNHNGKLAERTVRVETLELLISPDYGYQPGWFLTGFCFTKQARRSFALSRIVIDEDLPKTRVLLSFSLKEPHTALQLKDSNND